MHFKLPIPPGFAALQHECPQRAAILYEVGLARVASWIENHPLQVATTTDLAGK